jgi:hypothetical protein
MLSELICVVDWNLDGDSENPKHMHCHALAAPSSVTKDALGNSPAKAKILL